MLARQPAWSEQRRYEADPLPVHRADQQLVESLLDSSKVDRSPPQPAPSLYIRDVGTNFLIWLFSRLSWSVGLAGLVVKIGYWLVIALLISALLTLALLMPRLLRRRRGPEAYQDGLISSDGADQPTPADAAASWREMEQALARNQPGAALTALWWWLARRVAGSAADAAWTTRQLLRSARSPHQGASTSGDRLGTLCRRLDVMIYGPVPAQCGEIRELAQDLKEVLA